MDRAKIALHVQAHTTKGLCTTSAPSIPCAEYRTSGGVGVPYDVYVVVADVPYYEYGQNYSVGGVSWGLEYDGAPAQGLDIYSWIPCTDGLEFPHDGPLGPWPSAGSGNRLTWLTCQTTSIPPSGIHAIAGSFYVYAYGPDALEVSPNAHLESGPELKVAGCDASETNLPLSAAGRVNFSTGAVDPGFNPCFHPFQAVCSVVDRSIDIGEVAVGGYKDLLIRFKNDGTPGLDPVEGTVSEDCPLFSIQGGGSYYLPDPGDVGTCRVRISPTQVGELSCLIRIGSTCPDVELEGWADLYPQTELVPPSISLESLPGSTFELPFGVRNIGSALLTWNARVELGSLEEILADLDLHVQSILDAIPSRYEFTGGESGFSISEPPLVNGNIIKAEFSETLPYSDGVIASSDLLGIGGRYFTRKYPGLFVFVADLVGLERLHVVGGLSAIPNFHATDVLHPDAKYDAFLRRQSGENIPASLNHLFITAAGEAYLLGIPNSDNSSLTTNRLTRVFYLFYMGENGADIGRSAATLIARAFLESIHPYPEWMEAAGGDPVPPGESRDGLIRFSTSGLSARTYTGYVVTPTNAQNNSYLHQPLPLLPVSLRVLPVPDIEISDSTVTFPPIFAGDAGVETLAVSNTGNAPLEVRAILPPGVHFSAAPESLNVEPGGTAQIHVVFSPPDPGSYATVLDLATNDPDEASRKILLEGTGVPPPALSLGSQQLAAIAAPGRAAHKSIALANEGGNNLVFAVSSSEDWMRSEPASGIVVPGQSIVLAIILDPGELESGDRVAELRFITNDPGKRSATLPVRLHVESVDVRSFQIEPNTVNPSSQGHWIHAYVELPEGDVPEEIILETVLAQNLVPVQPAGYSVEDMDADGVLEVRFRFDRTALLRALPPEDQVEVVISGEIRDRHYFMARDSVRVLQPHLLVPNGGERLLAGSFQTVRWEADQVDNPDSVLLHYSPDDGVSWTLIAYSDRNGPFAWHLPLEPTEECVLRLEAYRSGILLGHDRTDASFAIVPATTGTESNLGISRTLLSPNVPNPFSNFTRISYALAAPGPVGVELFDVSGRRVRTLARGFQPEGTYELVWDGRDDAGRSMPTGLYVVRLQTPAAEMSRRIVLLR